MPFLPEEEEGRLCRHKGRTLAHYGSFRGDCETVRLLLSLLSLVRIVSAAVVAIVSQILILDK